MDDNYCVFMAVAVEVCKLQGIYHNPTTGTTEGTHRYVE